MNEKKENEMRVLSHFALVITLTIFSLVLIVLNFLLGWEKWTIPICVAAIITCIIMHVMHKPQENVRIHFYGILLLVELFYYCVNSTTIYDSTPVIIVVLIVLAMTQEKILAGACIAVGYFGMIFHLVMTNGQKDLLFDLESIVRSGWHFLLVAIASAVIMRIMGIVSQMTERFSKEIEALEAVNKSASDFLANVSHEIRTPVNAIIGLTGVCLEKERDEIICQDLQSVERAGRRVAEQISDILDYSEIDMNHLAVNEEDYMLSSVLNDLMMQIRPIKPAELELVIDVDPALPTTMHSDIAKLKKILWHLISNGLKYTREGGVYVRISSVEEPYGINLRIDVTDTGIGMSPEELERISERFYQANSSRTRSSSGLGLGMAIVSGFVSALQGFMIVESTLGKGTTVHVSIPQKVVDSTECMSVKRRERLSLGAFLHFEKFANANVREFYDSMLLDLVSGLKVQMHKVETVENLKKLVDNLQLTHLFVGEEEYNADIPYMEKIADEVLVIVVANDNFHLARNSKARIMVKPFYCFPVISILNMDVDTQEEEGNLTCPGVHALVVDDEPMNLMVARGIFKRYGMIVSTAASGTEAIGLCKKNDYDIIFMDHMMPGMDGVETMKRIRLEAIKGKRDIPIVALTANAVSTAKEMFLSEGFDGFVSKPVELTELERVLKKVLPKTALKFVKGLEAEAVGEKSNNMGLPAEGDDPKVGGSDKELALSETVMSGDGKESTATAALGACGIDEETGMYYCQNDQELYRELLLQFANDYEEKHVKLDEFLMESDWKNYQILVHAVKSTAKMIGAEKLSENARVLEMAAKEGNGEAIREGHDYLMAEYAKAEEGIRAYCGAGYGGSDKSAPVMNEHIVQTDDIVEFDPEGDKTGVEGILMEFKPEGGDES